MPNVLVSVRPAVRLGAAAALAAGALLAAAPAAGADARFRMTLTGVQRTTWNEDYPGWDGFACRGSGSEEASFSTSKPLMMTVKLVKYGRHRAVYHLFRRATDPPPSTFDVRATVTRQAEWAETSACPDMTDATRSARFRWRLWAPTTMGSDNWIVLNEYVDDGSPVTEDPFPDVVVYGVETFPRLMEEDARGRFIGGRVSTRRLLRSHQRRFRVRTNHSSQLVDDVRGITATTEVRWTMTLTRIGPRSRKTA